jgi:hypothetical protein
MWARDVFEFLCSRENSNFTPRYVASVAFEKRCCDVNYSSNRNRKCIAPPSVPMKILVGPFSLFDFCAAPITFLTYKLQPPFAQQKPECIHSARAPWRASAAMDATNNDLVVQLKINIVILPRVSCTPFLQLHRGINSPRSLFLHLKSD